MAQNVTLKLGGHTYTFKATSAEHEAYMRSAAADLNKRLESFARQYPTTPEVDKCLFAALNIGIEKIAFEKNVAKIKGEADTLKKATDVYIEGIGKK